jgi:acrylyl-CoA reductase (NADPH)
MCPTARRVDAWSRLSRDLDGARLAAMTTTIPFDGVIDTARDIIDGKVRGRVVVEVG